VSRRGLTIVVLVQLAALIAVCLLVGDNGWDDGAITLAFSKTFAGHGLVALTPHSETVEGFSTTSWFLLNALAALARPSYQTAILASQVLSALSICASTVLLARTCTLLGLGKLFSTLTVVAFAAWGCSYYEAANGMEMGLLAAAFLVMVNELVLSRPRLLLLGVGAALAVTTRFEAIAYVSLLALSVALVPGRRAFWGILLTCLGTVLLLSIWRLAVFRDFLPNTYWAKRWPPYAGFDFTGRVDSAVEALSFFLAPLIALEVLAGSGFDLAGVVRSRRQTFLILACPVLGAIVMGSLIGKHWGYDGRMPYFAFPPLLLLFALAFSAWVNAKRTRFRVAFVIGLYAMSVGTSMKSFPSGPLSAALDGGSFGVSPRTYAETGRVFRQFATAADLQHPAVLTPDVGGLALCCDEFRIVDLALLSNRRLAHNGQAALAEVLETESPEIIEAHWEWALAGHLYELPYFQAHYLPAFAGGTKLWLRSDVAKSIESKGRGCRVDGSKTELQEALGAHRYADHDLPADRRNFERAGVVFALNEADATSKNWCKE